jgi:hypothetical protein
MVDFVISGNKMTWGFGDKIMPILIFDLDQYRKEIDSKIKEFKRNKYNTT